MIRLKKFFYNVKNLKYSLIVITCGICVGLFLQMIKQGMHYGRPYDINLFKYPEPYLFALCFWVIWIFYSVIYSLLSNVELKDILKIDSLSYLPTLILLLYIIQFKYSIDYLGRALLLLCSVSVVLLKILLPYKYLRLGPITIIRNLYRHLIKSDKRDWIYITIIATIVVTIYWRTIDIFFIADDFYWVEIGMKGLRGFKHRFHLAFGGGFRPLVNLLLILLYNLFEVNYTYYHIVNIVTHIANCILVYYLTIKFYGDRKIAFLSGVLFSLLYIKWEAIARIMANTTVLLTFFYLLTLLSFIKYKETGLIKYYYISLSLFVIPLLIKETGITLIVMLFLYELYYSLKNRAKPINIKIFIPFGIIWTVYIIYLRAVIFYRRPIVEMRIYVFGWHFLSNYVKALYSNLILKSLSLYYPKGVFDDLWNSISAAIIILVVIVAIVGLSSNFISFLRRMFSSLKEHLYETIFFILFMLIYYFPFSFFLREGWAYPSRFLYGASIGFSIILAYILMEMYNLSSDKLGKFIVLMLVVLIILSNLQNLHVTLKPYWEYANRGKVEVEYLKKLDSSAKGKEIHLLDYNIALTGINPAKLYPKLFDLKHIVFSNWDKLFTSLEEHKDIAAYKYKGNGEFEEIKPEQVEDIFDKAYKLVKDHLEEARLYPDKIVVDNSLGGGLIKDRVADYTVSLGIIPPYAKPHLYRLASLSEILTLLKIRGVRIVLDGKIGDTGVISPIDMMVQSAGFEDGAYANIYLEWADVSPKGNPYIRGYNIIVLDNNSGEIEDTLIFDTCGSTEASHKLADFINQIPSGRVVIVAVADEASGSLTEDAVEALKLIGASQSVQGLFRYAHAVIGVKGAPSGTALEVLGDDPVGIVLFGKAGEKE